MQPLTIPRQLTRTGELVVIPRREYEDLLRTKITRKMKIEGGKPVQIKKRGGQKLASFYEQLDKELDEAIQEYKEGKCYGPFSSVEELRQSLGI